MLGEIQLAWSCQVKEAKASNRALDIEGASDTTETVAFHIPSSSKGIRLAIRYWPELIEKRSEESFDFDNSKCMYDGRQRSSYVRTLGITTSCKATTNISGLGTYLTIHTPYQATDIHPLHCLGFGSLVV